MSLIQLDYPIEVSTPLGRGYALLFESDGIDHWWTVWITANGALVTFRQKEIRVSRSYSHGGIPNEEMKKIIGGRNDQVVSGDGAPAPRVHGRERDAVEQVPDKS